MAKRITHGLELNEKTVSGDETDTESSRNDNGLYRFVRKFSDGRTESANVYFKDLVKENQIYVETRIVDYFGKQNSRAFSIDKENCSINPKSVLQQTGYTHDARNVHGDGYVSGEYCKKDNEIICATHRIHIHKIIENQPNEREIYRAIIKELNDTAIDRNNGTSGFKNLGTLLHEFHEYAEPDFHKRMESETPEDIEEVLKNNT